ncbi:MAG: ThuA domain-containing protein [Planctomycetota bacterium]|jgi:type 1 glutamine amidotransferase
MRQLMTVALVVIANAVSAAAGVKAFKVTPEWTARIEKIAPAKPTARPAKKHKALVFSLMTGFKHWVTPHTAEVVKVLGSKSGAFTVVESNDVKMFEPDNIKQFDLIVLNNNCSNRKKRDMFFDATKDAERAAALEKSLIAHIASGNGLVAIHGAIVMQNNSPEFSEMLGGSFDFHPKQQEVVCSVVDPKHPLVAAFDGKTFVHVDEPYLFRNAYKDKNFRPLLVMDTSKLNCGKKTKSVRSDVRYVAWIKRHGRGRVFYCSPSHNAQSFEKPELLRFLLDGIQYAAGDLECDDSPVGRKR